MRYITHEEAQRSLDALVELIYGSESEGDSQSGSTEDNESQPS
jgi:hypothetical protein